MDVLTPAPPSITERKPKRRGRIAVLIVGVLLLAVLGTAGGVVAYGPLREGSAWGLRGPSDVRLQRGVNEQAQLVMYESGAELEIEFTIRNEGLVGVTITDVLRDLSFVFYEVREIRRGVLTRCCVEFEAFSPFALGRNEERMIQLRGILRGCGGSAPGTSASWDGYEVSYRILGIPRTTYVKVRSPVIIEIPANYQCPEPSTVPSS